MLTPSRFYAHWKEKDAETEALDAEVNNIINNRFIIIRASFYPFSGFTYRPRCR